MSKLSPRGATVVVGLGWFLLGLLMNDVGRPYSWDEAVYVSQFSSFAEPLRWGPQRAPGMAVLVAPVVVVTDSIIVLRLWLLSLASIGSVVAFGAWTSTIGRRAAIAQALLGGTWLSSFYAVSVFPNLWLALLAVFGVGIVAGRDLTARPTLMLLGLTVAVAALFRPLEGALLLVVVVGIALTVAGRARVLPVAGAAAVGYTIGLVPWLVEAFATYGGPLARLDAASETVGASVGWRVTQFVWLLDGPMLGPDRGESVDDVVITWFVLVVVVALGGVFTAADHRGLVAGLVGAAVVLTAPFVFYSESLAPRFVLPALALAAVAGSFTVAALGPRGGGVLMVGVIGVSALQMLAVDEFVTSFEAIEQRIAEIADTVEEEAAGRPCVVLSRNWSAQLAFRSGCATVQEAIDADVPANDWSAGFHQAAVAGGASAFYVFRESDEVPADWPVVAVDASDGTRWYVAEVA
ncbi:MAG: hypothetical protein AAGE98_14075 [Actinomycetota bacterium]